MCSHSNSEAAAAGVKAGAILEPAKPRYSSMEFRGFPPGQASSRNYMGPLLARSLSTLVRVRSHVDRVEIGRRECMDPCDFWAGS